MKRAALILLLPVVACATAHPAALGGQAPVAASAPAPAALLTPAAQRPALLALHEDDSDAHTYALPRGAAIVDVGSTIRVELQRENIAAAAPGSSGAAAQLVARYTALTDALANVNAAMPEVANALSAWSTAHRPQDLAALKQANGKLAIGLLKILQQASAQGGERLRANINDALTPKAPGVPVDAADQAKGIVRSTRTELEELGKELDGLVRGQGIAFLLGGWLVGADGTRPIHIEGFDTYAPGERVTFDRTKVVLDAQQQEQVRRNDSIAHTFNTEGAIPAARTAGKAALESLLQRTSDAAQGVISAVQNVGSGPLGAAAASVQKTATDVAAYGELLRGLLSKYQTATPASGADLLLGANADVQQAVERGRALAEEVANSAKAVAALAAPPPAVLAALKELTTALQEDLVTVGGSLQQLFGMAAINAGTLQFGEEVRRLSFDQVPASASIDLDATGRRVPGDSVVVTLATAHGDSVPTPLETHRVVMHRIVPYFDTTAGLIFAHAPASGEHKAGFQAGAAYSVLLKRGLRGWGLWDTLLTPGIGISLSALDFNRDNTPELGVAATVSLLRDILQTGYGYNVFADRWYFFFGIGLPLPALGGTPTSSVAKAP